MTKPFETWTVLPHGVLTEIDAGLLTVSGTIPMPLVDLPRRMTVVRLRDARLIIYNAIALEEDEMTSLEAYGVPSYLIVPGDHHRLDAKTWKTRYPGVKVVAPAGARAKVEEIVPVDATVPAFDDPRVEFITVPGTQGHEAALMVRTATGTSLVLNDLVANIRHESGFGGWLLRMGGFAGAEPQIPKLAKMALVKDSEALRTQLLQWSEIESLKRILVAHGSPIDNNPRQALRELANSLSS